MQKIKIKFSPICSLRFDDYGATTVYGNVKANPELACLVLNNCAFDGVISCDLNERIAEAAQKSSAALEAIVLAEFEPIGRAKKVFERALEWGDDLFDDFSDIQASFAV